jgi:hypothetical protein
MMPRRKARTPKPAKPENHLYTHPWKPEAKHAEQLAALPEISGVMRMVLTKLGYQVLMRAGEHRVLAPTCFADPTHATPEDAPERFPMIVKGDKIVCETGGHEITAKQLLEIRSGGDPAKMGELLDEIRLGAPGLQRLYCFESGEEGADRVVDPDPLAGLQHLRLGDAKTVRRGVVIEAPSLAIAQQLCGQIRDKLPWCEHIPLRHDGAVDVRWHRGWLTETEKRLLRAQQQRDQQDLKETKARELRIFQMGQQQ